tara:strand:+ start:457 stop:690 length:234 start_codon:yes stop_codon:yes gene_type:complete
MFRKSKGRNKVIGAKWFVEKRIGKKLTIPAENNEAFSLLVIFLPMKKIVRVRVDRNKLGKIFVTSVIGNIKLKNAMK